MEAMPAEWSVRRGRDAYLAENGFTAEAYDAAWTPATLFGLPFAVPNTERHRWAIMLHDLHHVATGYGTDLAGEAEISAWELRRGLRLLGWYVSGLVTLGAVMGLVVAPRRTVAAWRASGRATTSLFQRDVPYEALLEMSIGEVRAMLGVPPAGLARKRGLHARARPAGGATRTPAG